MRHMTDKTRLNLAVVEVKIEMRHKVDINRLDFIT